MMSRYDEKDFLACCGSTRFAREMASAAPFSDCDAAAMAARDIWFNKVDVNGWLEAFAAHPQIGRMPSQNHKSPTSAQWSKGEQATALATATDSSLQELSEWNARYMDKFGFVFLICASGRSTSDILTELKRRYEHRPIIELEIAAGEQMRITELRLAKLFQAELDGAIVSKAHSITDTSKLEGSGRGVSEVAGKKLEAIRNVLHYPWLKCSMDSSHKLVDILIVEDRMNIIGAHLRGQIGKPAHIPPRSRPPITTHILDVARGCPAKGVEVLLEVWKGNQPRPNFGGADKGGWVLQGSSATDKDGRSGHLMKLVEDLDPGVYRISFNTGKYNPDGFFPFVSIVFEIRESQKWEHFHVPLLLSPFSFSTYRGS